MSRQSFNIIMSRKIDDTNKRYENFLDYKKVLPIFLDLLHSKLNKHSIA